MTFERTVSQWVAELSARGAPDNVRRALRALYRHEVTEAWRLPGLGAGLARELERRGVRADLPRIAGRTASPDGTEKVLLEVAAGRVEAVLIPEVRLESSAVRMRLAMGAAPRDRSRKPPRAAGCLSSQVGCAVGCRFCASGLLGLASNLSASELVGQAVVLRALARERGAILATLVFMGMGEPLHNVEALTRAIENLTDPWGGGFGAGMITVSTVGVLAGIERLAALGRSAPNLALSLHAPDDATRERIVPMPRLLRVSDALEAARRYAATTRRFVTVSYVLLDGVNDSPAHADELSRLLEGSGFHVNLIPWNPVPEVPFGPSPQARAQEFWERLRARGTACHFRKARGAGQDSACGQLRRRDAAAPGATRGERP